MKKHLVIDTSFFTVSFSRFAPLECLLLAISTVFQVLMGFCQFQSYSATFSHFQSPSVVFQSPSVSFNHFSRFQSWPSPSAEMCRGFLLYKFRRILPGIFLEDFSGHFFPTKRGEKIRRQNPRTKSGSPEIKIREKSVLPKADPSQSL